MANSKLIIDGVSVGYNSLLPISTNYSIADIKEPDRRNSSYTKSITIPSTKEINQIFEFAFEINILTNSFNPNLKVSAQYYVNEVLIFDGYIRLIEVIKRYDGQFLDCDYQCALIGNNGNFFLSIYNLLLTDIDFSDLDHNFIYSSGKVIPATPGIGYFYPNIDYGHGKYGYVSGSPGPYVWFDELKPAIWELEYVSRIFSAAGYTFTSAFLNSTYYSKIFIPDSNAGKLKMSQTDLLNSQFLAGRAANTSDNYAGAYTGGANFYWTYSPAHILAFNDDTTGAFNDDGANYNTGTFIFTQPFTAAYNINSTLDWTIVLTPPAGTATILGYADVYLDIEYNDGAGWISYLLSYQNVLINSTTTNSNMNTNIPPTVFPTARQWRVITYGTVNINYKDGASANITNPALPTSLLFYTNASNSSFYALVGDSTLQYNETVDMSLTVPRDIRQIDLITSIIKCENLYMDIDKDNPTNYLIEDRETFIDETDVVDWTTKLDVSQPMVIKPMGDLDFKRYTWKFKEDADILNQTYQNKFKQSYGTQVLNIENDFNTNEKTTEVIFSNTPVGQSGGITIVAPRFYTLNSNVKQNIQVNIRRLYYGGQTNVTGQFFYLNSPTVNVLSGSMVLPFCGHVDNPTTPTLDLSFGTPKEIYWSLPGQSYSSNNRYNVMWSKFIAEITDRDSKIVVASFNLSEYDIRQFKFSQLVYCDQTYYLCNKILDYDPQNEGSVKVELLKLKAGTIFSGGNEFLRGQGGDYVPNQPEFNNNGNYGPNSFGSNNINYDLNTFVFGDNIRVDT